MPHRACLLLPLLLVACGDQRDEAPAARAAATEATSASGPAAPAEIAASLPAAPAAPEPAAAPAEPTDIATLIGDVKPASDPRFAPVPDAIAGKAGMYGRKEAIEALTRMAEAARTDGVSLKVVSAFRSFKDQKRIWEDKWEGRTEVEGGRLPETAPDPEQRALKILEYSSMPATSRHHWGTDFDLNALANAYFDTGEGRKVYDWLVQHARDYGFCQTYSAKGAARPVGYEEERWHWSYLPLARSYLDQYPAIVGYEHITGFKGAEAARDVDVITNYVAGINPDCR